MTSEILLFAGLLTILYLLITTFPVSRRVRRLKRELRIEKTRSHWAEARAALFDLMRAGKVPLRSSTFCVLYGMQTFVLRRPEAYGEIAKGMTLVVNSKQPPLPDAYYAGWLLEQQYWPPEMKAVLGKMAQGTVSLLMSHAGYSRLLFAIARLLPGAARISGQSVLGRVEKWLADFPSSPIDRDLVAAAARMEEMHQNAA